MLLKFSVIFLLLIFGFSISASLSEETRGYKIDRNQGIASILNDSQATLYFSDASENYLVSVKTSYPDVKASFNGESDNRIRIIKSHLAAKALIQALIAGPEGVKNPVINNNSFSGVNRPENGEPVLNPTIPKETTLKALYITGNGTAYVDFSGEIRTHHPGGVKNEMLTLYSIVNTLILNISDIRNVKILIDGHESDTLNGHIDIRFPINANMLLIR